MHQSVYDLKVFYAGKTGRVVRRVIQQKIRHIWPDAQNETIYGIGYAAPYMRHYLESSENLICGMMSGLGVHAWPQEGENRVCLMQEDDWPIETSSVDRLLIMHALEYVENIHQFLEEAWRVLKGNGRILVIVPNRRGLWSSAEWTPFGHGRPFSASQIHNLLKDSRFVHEKTFHSLFIPPVRWSLIYESSPVLEKVGAALFPAFSGVHIIEASKQVYAGTPIPKGLKQKRLNVKGLLAPKPFPTPD